MIITMKGLVSNMNGFQPNNYSMNGIVSNWTTQRKAHDAFTTNVFLVKYAPSNDGVFLLSFFKGFTLLSIQRSSIWTVHL